MNGEETASKPPPAAADAVPSAPYAVIRRVPSVEEYNRIRGAAGMSVKDVEAARIGLANTLFAVVVEHRGRAIAIGRVIGDGGCFFDITDIAVEPLHQGRGLGHCVMSALMDYIHKTAKPGAFVSLIADRGVAGFYRRYGFTARPEEAPGMSFVVR